MLSGYLLFCLITALHASFSIFHSILKEIEDDEHVVLEHSIISRITFFCLAFVAAPVMFFVVIVPNLHRAFYDAMLEDFNK